MEFKEFLESKGIPYREEVPGEIAVDDSLIYPYELEYRQAVPGGELWVDYLRYRLEPNRSTDELGDT